MWDYLIVTAANEQQAAAYEGQIRARSLPQVKHSLVVADAGGRRIGSGGSTIQCLEEVLRLEGGAATAVLRRLRILIVHAGGDSRRLPAYSPCGKIFVPLPGDSTLFDRLVPAFLSLPQGPANGGQVVVAAGDALILFDSAEVDFSRPGIIALASRATPAEAARHGVLCPNADATVRLYLQKPSVEEQARQGAINHMGRSALDIGVMSLDASAAAAILRVFGTPEARQWIALHGIDLYREICCALGTDTNLEHYRRAARSSGTKLDDSALAGLFAGFREIPFSLQTLSRCDFLHFGTTRQLITSGLELAAPPDGNLIITTEISGGGRIEGRDCWVEGCRVRAPLTLQRNSVVVGVDIEEPFDLPEGGCLDVSPGASQWFIRYYGIDDSFKGPNYCGRPLSEWLRVLGVPEEEVWNGDRTLWNARIFPAGNTPQAYRQWRWMLDVDRATPQHRRAFLEAERFSCAEIAVLVDQAAFHARRAAIPSRAPTNP